MDPTPRAPTLSAQAQTSAVPTAADRERVVQALSTHFANDQLSMEEFEDRLERAYKATSVQQLAELLTSLPAAGGTQLTPGSPVLIAPAAEVPATGTVVAVMGMSARQGSWLVPRRLRVYAVMGGAVIDLREARFAAGVTEIEAYAVMGGVEIVVPPGVRVESFGTAFMGGFEGHAGESATLSPLHPIVRLSGLAVMGGVEVKTRAPGDQERGSKGKRGTPRLTDADR